MLSLQWIARALRRELSLDPVLSPGPDTAVPRLTGLCPLLPQARCTQELLYFTTGPLPEGKPALLIAAPECPPYAGPCLYLKTGDGLSPGAVCNAVSELFQSLAQWQRRLPDAIAQEDMQALLDLSAPILGMSLYFVDPSFRWAAASGELVPFFTAIGRQMPTDFITMLKSDTLGTQIHQHRDAFLSPDPYDYFPSQPLCYNLFSRERYAGRLIALSPIRGSQVLEADIALMNQLGRCAQLLLQQSYQDSGQPHFAFTPELYQDLLHLLNGEAVPQSQLAQHLENNGWRETDGYHVGCLKLNQNDAPVNNAQFYSQDILTQFPEVFPIPRSDQILLLLPRRTYPTLDSFLTIFREYVRENNFRLGLSNPGERITDLPHIFRQAQLALTYGSQKNHTVWIHLFSTYLLDYLIQARREMPTRCLCAPELLTLRDYDAKNDTEYCKTLKAYLENQFNAVQTAKALYIHHATMVYRLKRLKELIGTDLKDMDKLIHIYLSLRILEQTE